MHRRDTRRNATSRVRHDRGLALGIAVPAVVGVGALPAFAAHSADHVDELEPDTLELYGEEIDEFSGAQMVDADEEIPEAETGLFEENYDPYADGEEGDVTAGEESDDAEAEDGDENGAEGRSRAAEASDGRSEAAGSNRAAGDGAEEAAEQSS